MLNIPGLPEYVIKNTTKGLFATWVRRGTVYGSVGKWAFTDDVEFAYAMTKEEAKSVIKELKKLCGDKFELRRLNNALPMKLVLIK